MSSTLFCVPQETVSRSATLVLLARAHLHWMGVIDDPYALQMLPRCWSLAAETLRLPGLGRLGRNPSFAYLGARTRFYDQFVSSALDDGITQIVILAAGYDTRSWRLARQGATFFEIDLPVTQEDKRTRFPREGPVYVPMDLTEPTLIDALVAGGFDRALPAAFTAEGLTIYLTEGHVASLLARLADDGGRSSRLAVNFGVGFERQGNRRGRIGRRTMASGGEEFRFRLQLSEAPEFLARAGWTVERLLTGAQLAEAYLLGTDLERVSVTTSAFAVIASNAGAV